MNRAVLVSFIFSIAISVRAEDTDAAKHEASLKQALGEWYKAMASEKKEDRVKALKAMRPTKEDIKTLYPQGLFGNSAETMAALTEESEAFFTEHVDDIAKEVSHGGAVVSIELIDVRKKPIHDPEVDALPKDIPVFEAFVKSERGSAGTNPFMFVNGHWLQLSFAISRELSKKLKPPPEQKSK